MNENQVVEYVNERFREYFGKLSRPPKTETGGNVLFVLQIDGLRIARFSLELFHNTENYNMFLDTMASILANKAHQTLMKYYEIIQKPFRVFLPNARKSKIRYIAMTYVSYSR